MDGKDQLRHLGGGDAKVTYATRLLVRCRVFVPPRGFFTRHVGLTSRASARR